MIQDIGEGIFSNAFSIESVCEGDFLFCYRGEDILLKKFNGTYELPIYGELTPKCHHIFSLKGNARWFPPEEIEKPMNDISVFSELVWIFLNKHGIWK